MIALLIYALCALLSIAIAAMLWRQQRRTRSRLLYWTALCFSGLALNNLVLVVDKLLVPGMDLSLLRQATALIALGVMLVGLTWEDE